jgi:hypothetical protein
MTTPPEALTLPCDRRWFWTVIHHCRGAGAMGEVYVAKDTKLEREVGNRSDGARAQLRVSAKVGTVAIQKSRRA